jgi:hypothetical protein
MGNPLCPEPNCHRLMYAKNLGSILGMTPCPKCGTGESKPYILTEKKKGMVKCLRCRQDYKPKRREGYGKYWVCTKHPWQRFKIGAETIIRKEKPKSDEEINEMLKPMQFQQAQERRQFPNVRMSPQA